MGFNSAFKGLNLAMKIRICPTSTFYVYVSVMNIHHFPSAAGFRLSYSDRIFLLWIVRWCLISVGIWKRAHSLSRPRCAQSAGLSEYPLLYSSECCGQMAGCTLKQGKCGEFEDKLLEQEERQREIRSISFLKEVL